MESFKLNIMLGLFCLTGLSCSKELYTPTISQSASIQRVKETKEYVDFVSEGHLLIESMSKCFDSFTEEQHAIVRENRKNRGDITVIKTLLLENCDHHRASLEKFKLVEQKFKANTDFQYLSPLDQKALVIEVAKLNFAKQEEQMKINQAD